MSGELAARIVAAMADAAVVCDAEGRVAALNPAAAMLLGDGDGGEGRIGRAAGFVEGEGDGAARRWSGYAAGALEEEVWRRADGRAVAVESRVSRLEGPGGWLLVVARDVSARRSLEDRLRRKTEELEALVETQRLTQETLLRREKLAALGGLVAGIAHEINTPLGVNLTACSLVEERLTGLRGEVLGGTATRRRFLEQIDGGLEAARLAVENGRRAAELVASFKKVAVDQASEAARVVELPAYLQDVVDSLRPVIKQAHVKVTVSGTPAQLHTRPGQIAQVVTNLITNAITHAFEEHPDPRVEIRCAPAAGGVSLTVEDNGWGMSEEVRRRAFEPFFTTRMGRGGSGLGLHIVYNIIVDGLGGEVELDSAPGQGTSFRLHLPTMLGGL